MRLADFPLFDPDVYVVRADVSAPKLLNPLAQVRAWQDDALGLGENCGEREQRQCAEQAGERA